MKRSNIAPSVKANYLFNVISQFVTFMIPMVTNPYVSRIFGADGIGISSYTAANVTYFTLFGMLGISGYGQREIAIWRDDRQKVSQIFWELQLLHLITFMITGIAYLFLALNSPEYRVYYLVQYITIVASFLDINWFFQAYERFRFIAIRNCAIKLLSVAAIFLLIHDSGDLAIYIGITSMGTLLSNVSLWIGMDRYVDRVPVRSLNLRRHLKSVLVFFIPTIAASVYSILDKSVINWITKDNAENGYYEQANKILIIANVFVQSLSNVAAPRMSNLYSKNNMEEFSGKLNKALAFMLMISLPTAFGVAAIADRFVPLFFGAGFEKTTYILYVFMPMVVILGFSVYLDGMYLVPAGRRAESARAVCIGSATNLVLNIVLVYWFRSVGAAVATLITEGVVSGMMIWMSRRMIDWKALKAYGGRYLLASVVMFALVHLCGYIVKNDFLCLAIQLCLGVGVYGCLLLMMKDTLVLQACKTVLGKLKRHG